jgi:hypothetical protein
VQKSFFKEITEQEFIDVEFKQQTFGDIVDFIKKFN